MTDADYDPQRDTPAMVRAGDVEGDVKALGALLESAQDMAQMLEGDYPQMFKVGAAILAALSLVKPLLDGLS